MNAVDIINKTKRKIQLDEEEIKYLVNGYTSGEIPDYQMSAMMMAIYFVGMNEQETLYLTMAMAESGEMLEWETFHVEGMTAQLADGDIE